MTSDTGTTIAARATLTGVTTPPERLANCLRVARAERRISQSDLATAVGVSRQTVSSIETGQYVPSALLAFRLARALDFPVDRLFWLEGEES